MGTPRSLPPVIEALTHEQGMKRCITMTSSAIHTVQLPEGHFACIVFNTPKSPAGAVSFLDRAEAEALIVLLRNAIEDADRLNAGKPAIHAAPTLTRQ